jgi:integrase
MAWIEERSGKYLVYDSDPATKKHRHHGTFAAEADAKALGKLIEARRHHGDLIDPDLRSTLYVEWAQRWYIAKEPTLKPKTREDYTSLLNNWVLPEFGHRKIGSIQNIDVELWVADMRNQGLSASRIRKAYRLLSASLQKAAVNRMIPFNPAQGVKLPQDARREMRVVSPAQIDAIAQNTSDEYATLVYVLGYCGLRTGEAAALRRSDINEMHNEIRVKESMAEVGGKIFFGTPKNGKSRTVAVPSFLMKWLVRHLELYTEPGADAFVFSSPRGNPLRMSNVRHRVWKPAVNASDVPSQLVMHDLRHSAASILINQGMHPLLVKEHLGHSTIRIPMDLYGHMFPNDRARVSDALENAYTHGLVGISSDGLD